MRRRLGLSSIGAVESRLTFAQIQLYLHWEMRDARRSITIHEVALKSAIAWAFPAK